MADDGAAPVEGMTRFAKYAATGVVTNLLAYAAFLALLWSAVPPAVSSAGAYALGLTLSYRVNRRWAFRSNAGHQRDLPRFGVAYAIGFVYTVGSMAVLSRVMAPEAAQVLVILSCAGVIYACLVLFRFGR
jgi:putative flippase GtrA